MDRDDTHRAWTRRAPRPDRSASRTTSRRRTVVALVAGLTCVGVLASGCTDATRSWRASWLGAHHYAAGSEALERGDALSAIAELREAARLVPHASEIRNHLGLAYWRVGALAEAGAAFETALALDCDNEAARRNLARLDAFRASADRGAATEAREASDARSGDG